MKRLRRLSILSGIAAVVGVGVVASLVLRPIAPVTVVVKNTSGKAIESVRLEHERGVEILANLEPGDAKTIRFAAGGETSYRLNVRFADGSELAGGGGYAEAGYEFSEAVGDSAIRTEARLPAGY